MEIGISIKQRLFQIAEIIHLRVFGHAMSDGMGRFLGNLNYVFMATLVVGVLIYTLNIMAGRWLSVEDYGRYQLALSMSFFLIIPISMGLTTAGIHALAKKNGDQKKIISSMLLLTAFFGTISVPLMLLFSGYIADLIGVEKDLIIAAVIYTAFFSLYSILRSVLQGLLDFRRIAVFEAVYAVVASVTYILFLVVLKRTEFWLPLAAFSFGFLIFGIACIPIIRRYFELASFSSESGKMLLKNGLIMVAASVSGFLLGNIDRFIINGLIDIETVALYSAYAYSAGVFLNFFLQTFITVFFPSMSYIDDASKVAINQKINRLYGVAFVPLFLLSFLFIVVSFSLFGEKYTISYAYATLFSAYIMVQFFVSTKQWLLASFGEKGMLYSTYATVLASATNVVIVYLFTKYYGLGGAASGLIVSLILFIFINRYFLELLFRRGEDNKYNQSI